jgi:hypothetical protein
MYSETTPYYTDSDDEKYEATDNNNQARERAPDDQKLDFKYMKEPYKGTLL